MKYTYRTKGTCSRSITFDIEDGVVRNVQFEGGCNGNLKGIGAIVDGMKVEDVIDKLSGIRCDQLAQALMEATHNGR